MESKKHFSDDETFTLINIWGENKFLKMFKNCKKHSDIFNKISDEMKMYNYERSSREIKNKLNNLKQEYNKLKPKSGGETPTWKYFEKLNIILGAKDKYNSHLGEDSFIEGCATDTIEISNSNSNLEIYEEVQYLKDDIEGTELQSSCSTSFNSVKDSNTCSTSKPSKKRKSDDAIENLLELSRKNQNILESLLSIEERREKREEIETELTQKVSEAMIRFLEFNSK